MDELIRYLSERNILQTKALRKSLDSLSLEEKQEFIKIINFYKENYTISELGDAYLLFTEDTLKETKYYVEHGTYRYSTFAEVADYVYYNKEYMTKYMLGLGLSAYLWSSHIKIHRWWQSLIRNIGGGGIWRLALDMEDIFVRY